MLDQELPVWRPPGSESMGFTCNMTKTSLDRPGVNNEVYSAGAADGNSGSDQAPTYY